MASNLRAIEASWQRSEIPAETRELVEAGFEPWWAEILARRGVIGEAGVEAFLNPSLSQLHDPSRLSGLQTAVERVIRARDLEETVAIVGDYDVDGISATALLTAVFKICGVQSQPILPNRHTEGYGFQSVHVERAARGGCRLIVTADCGSTSVEAAQAALARGIDVIVTDHHLGGTDLPPEVVEINPNSSPDDYPFPHLSGAGVAYKLALGLVTETGRDVDHVALLRIACLGTICDLVPLIGENRVIAALGLEALPQTRSVGLRALMRLAGVQPPLAAADVGFRLGPRLNAAGRLAAADPALELLLTRDEARADQQAAHLDRWNRERQKAEAQVVEEATARFAEMDDLPPILVAWSPEWHQGVVGIAAGRLARQFHRPTVLLSVQEGLATGSGRSIRALHLFEVLSHCSQEYERFGGHSQAIGLTVQEDRLDELHRHWISAAGSWDADLLHPIIEFEATVAPAELSSDLLDRLRRLEPHGVGNRQPILRTGPLALDGRPRRFGKGHLSAKAIADDGTVINLLGWGWQVREDRLQGRFEVVGYLEHDNFENRNVLRLIDARVWEHGGAPTAEEKGARWRNRQRHCRSDG